MVTADAWFAVIPVGIEIMIAIEKLKATITRAVLIFLREMFLTALEKAPKSCTPLILKSDDVKY
jgi:hypothetical protein